MCPLCVLCIVAAITRLGNILLIKNDTKYTKNRVFYEPSSTNNVSVPNSVFILRLDTLESINKFLNKHKYQPLECQSSINAIRPRRNIIDDAADGPKMKNGHLTESLYFEIEQMEDQTEYFQDDEIVILTSILNFGSLEDNFYTDDNNDDNVDNDVVVVVIILRYARLNPGGFYAFIASEIAYSTT